MITQPGGGKPRLFGAAAGTDLELTPPGYVLSPLFRGFLLELSPDQTIRNIAATNKTAPPTKSAVNAGLSSAYPLHYRGRPSPSRRLPASGAVVRLARD